MSATGPDWLAAFAARLDPLLARMRDGEDVPPALWHRAEGFAEAGLATGAVDADALAAMLEQAYAAALGHGIEGLFGTRARELIDTDGAVRLCFRLPRAPVYPGTRG